MEKNLNFIVKVFFFLLFITISVNLFYLGYNEIQSIKKDKKFNNITNNKTNIDLKNKETKFKKDKPTSLILEKEITYDNYENEIIITVKKK